MTKREVIKAVLDFKKPPYVPWSFGFTLEAKQKLMRHYGTSEIERSVENHIIKLGADSDLFTDMGGECVRDNFGVVWDRSRDKDIGNVVNCLLPEPTLKNYVFPDPLNPVYYKNIPAQIERYRDRFHMFKIGFSLFERAWSMRGMVNLLMDFHDNPGFAKELLNSIADYNIALITEALKFDIDAVYLGDDWGQQRGLLMGPRAWTEFIYPVIRRIYGFVRDNGKYVLIHCCGDVDELFDALIGIGLNCFNPFQPEVMDVQSLLAKYRGCLAFHGGMSTQRTLPFGSVEDVRNEVSHLLQLGMSGSYILSPAHGVEGDVPLENMLAFIEMAQNQPGFRN